jgi:hypothetical protein
MCDGADHLDSGADLAIRMSNMAPSQEVEEVTFDQGRLVHVLWDPQGAAHLQTGPSAQAEHFYFGQEGLISWVRPGGTITDSNNVDFRFWSRHLLEEAERFSRGPQR